MKRMDPNSSNFNIANMDQYGTFTPSEKDYDTRSAAKKRSQITCVLTVFILCIGGALYVYLRPPDVSKLDSPDFHKSAHQICIPKKFNYSSNVCICNSNYCDNIPSINELTDLNKFILMTSSKDGLRFHKEVLQFKKYIINDTLEEKDVYYIPRDATNQKIIGFGGSFSDSAGINILSLNSAAQENLLKLLLVYDEFLTRYLRKLHFINIIYHNTYFTSYFGKDGIGYTMSRVPIGSTDFSFEPYTYNDMNDEFALRKEDFKLKIPLIKLANKLSGNIMKHVGTAWSAPNWMKTIDSVYNGSLKAEYYQLWADYHIQFLDSYKENGVEFWALTTGNDPRSSKTSPRKFSSMVWSPVEQRDWITKNIGPALANSKHKNTNLITLDDNRDYLSVWSDYVMNTNEVEKYIQGFGIHWYSDSKISPDVLAQAHHNHPNKFLLYTESCAGFGHETRGVNLGSWERAEEYIEDMIDSINHRVAGWIDWNLALDEDGGPNWVQNYVDSPIIVNSKKDEFYKQPVFYAIGHLSKFIPPESFHIAVDSHSDNPGIKVMAAERPDNGITVVFHNKDDKPKKITFVDILRGVITVTVPSKSINTIIYNNDK